MTSIYYDTGDALMARKKRVLETITSSKQNGAFF